MSNALKAITKTDTELRVGNYMVLFGGRDLEGIASPRKNRDGSIGEFFTKSTRFDSAYTDLDMVAIDWEHGVAPEGEPGPHDLLGRVDWKSARVDERGLFVERVLNRRNQYVQYLEELIDAGLIGTSSEAIGKGIEKGDDGEIKFWPIKRDSLTVSPMDHRMLSENTLSAIKSLSTRLPALNDILANPNEDAETAEPEADRTSAATVAPESDDARRIQLELSILEISTS